VAGARQELGSAERNWMPRVFEMSGIWRALQHFAGVGQCPQIDAYCPFAQPQIPY
jgi:hypothetical protein